MIFDGSKPLLFLPSYSCCSIELGISNFPPLLDSAGGIIDSELAKAKGCFPCTAGRPRDWHGDSTSVAALAMWIPLNVRVGAVDC